MKTVVRMAVAVLMMCSFYAPQANAQRPTINNGKPLSNVRIYGQLYEGKLTIDIQKWNGKLWLKAKKDAKLVLKKDGVHLNLLKGEKLVYEFGTYGQLSIHQLQVDWTKKHKPLPLSKVSPFDQRLPLASITIGIHNKRLPTPTVEVK